MSRHWSITTAIAFSLVAAPLAAQAASQDTTVVTTVPTAAAAPTFAPNIVSERQWFVAPVAASAPVATQVRATDAATASVRAMFEPGTSRNAAMMIVGGAAIIVGSVVGGNGGGAIAVGGGVLGLVGLWNYMK